jgi:hypothetical protein
MASIVERYAFHTRDLMVSPDGVTAPVLRGMLQKLAMRRVSGQLRPDDVSDIQRLEREIEDELDGFQRPGGA